MTDPAPPAHLPPMHTPSAPGLPHLSEKDSTILSVLFDPESTPSTNASTHQHILIDPSLPPDPHIPAELLPGIKQREAHAVLEAEAAISSDPGGESASYSVDLRTLEHALETLNKLIEDFPRYASAYNNRAQIRGLLLRRKQAVAGEDTNSAPEQLQLASSTSPGVATVESDLHSAITLATGGGGTIHPFPASSPLERVSPAQAKVLQSAYNQLATLYLVFFRAAKGADADAEGQYSGDLAMSPEHWEERASHCFRLAGRYGSELGRAMAVRTNPYARMCAGMVREVMKREVQGVGNVAERMG